MASRHAILWATRFPGSFKCRQASFNTFAKHLQQVGSNSYGSERAAVSNSIGPNELEATLAEPTWSVESLLPPKSRPDDAPLISSQQLHHLLRLSALPMPNTPEEEKKMLDTLSAQLHFVGKIQQVDTSGVVPLRAIRDETAVAEAGEMVTLDSLKDAFAKEKIIGKHYKRIQRDESPVDAKEEEDWDVLGSADKKMGRYFIVESERPAE